MDEFIPSRFTTTRHNLPWLTRGIKRYIKKKKRLYNKAKHTGSTTDWHRYRRQKELVQNLLRKECWDYIERTLTKSLEEKNSRPFWRYIKECGNDNIGIPPIRDGNELCDHSRGKAELLNKQFQSVFTKDNDSKPDIPGNPYPDVDAINITTEGVIKLLSKLEANKASGPDRLPNRVLKTLAKEIGPMLHCIFVQSLDTGSLPNDWLEANITPIYKKGDRHDASNYRPVSLTVVCCKLLEHIICTHLRNHFNKLEIFSPFQHGFRKRHSCESQLVITWHDLAKHNDLKHQVDLAIYTRFFKSV